MYRHKNGLNLHRIGVGFSWEMAQAKNSGWATQHRSILVSPEMQKEYQNKMLLSDHDYHLMVEVDDSKQEIGIVNVSNIDFINRSASVGMMALEFTKGQAECALMPEIVTDFAFEFLNLHRLEAEVLENNPAAMKFDLKLGYQIEGVKRKAVFKCNKYHDSYMIAMLREDWEKSDRVRNYNGICNLNYKERKPIQRVIDRIQKSRATST